MPVGSDRRLEQAFRPRARLLQLLGDQLIGSAKLAVFELVKNAYDADASEANVTLGDLDTDAPWIRIQDNGQGMSLDTIRDVWLVPGDDHREQDRNANRRSPRFHRLPLGEKGLGRFAVHKLGNRIRLATRAAGHRECFVEIDWSRLVRERFLDSAMITASEREARIFTGDRTGTRIRVDGLHQQDWSRREIRDLYRQVTSITSPFREREDNFKINFLVPEHQSWISELPDAAELLERAPWKFDFEFDGVRLAYKYQFLGVPGLKLEQRVVERAEPLQIIPPHEPDDLDPATPPRRVRAIGVLADQDTIRGIGPVRGTFYVFDRDREVLSRYAQSRLISRFLDQNGGVRVYRDDIRVYNYGEPGDDWLGLDLRRVNAPTRNLSRNIVLGTIDLDLALSGGLREKTNREGFVENLSYSRLRQIVLGIMSVLETERRSDKQRIRDLTAPAKRVDRDVAKPLDDIRRIARACGFFNEVDASLTRVENEYRQLRDDFLRAGLSQVGLAIVFHEVERGIGALSTAMEGPFDEQSLRRQVGQLQGVLETSTQLLRKGDKKSYSLRQLAKRARDLSAVRFRVHGVRFSAPSLEDTLPDITSTFAFGLALGALTNIIDNSIHWLKVGISDPAGMPPRRLLIDIVPDYKGRPAILVADNGPGFRDPPDQLVEAFFSRRPEGMGLGLYYANLSMSLNDGELVFPSMDEFDIPDEFNGAAVAMVFAKGK